MATKDGKKTGGRKKGTPNKATRQAREAIATFVDGNAERLQDWLDKIEQQDGPLAAFKAFSDLLEYHVPKLSRSEITGEDGGPVPVQFVAPEQYTEGGWASQHSQSSE